MTLHRLIWICAFCLLAFTSLATNTLRVATYNIYFDNRNLDGLVQAILDSKADIVALQETSPLSEAYLKRKLRLRYPHNYFQGHRGEYGAERCGFLSKHRLVKVRFLPPQGGLFGTLLGTFEWQGRQVQLASVHLCPARLAPENGISGNLKALAEADVVRRKEIEQITAALEPGLPAMILGDFNSISSGSAPVFLRGKAFVDSYASVNAEADKGATFIRTRGGISLPIRIDFIFHNASFKTLKSQVLPNTASDHFLVVSELMFVPQNAKPKL